MNSLCLCPIPGLDGDDDLVHEGWAVLTKNSFCTFPNQEESRGGLPTEAVLLEDMKTVGIDSSRNVRLETADGVFVMRFDREDCAKQWVELLQRCADEVVRP